MTNTEKIEKTKLRDRRLDAAGVEHKRRGTAVPFVQTLRDLSLLEKAEFLDDVMLRSKGRLPKNNPFRAEFDKAEADKEEGHENV